MAHETVPADIAAAIDMLIDAENHQAGEEVRRDAKAHATAGVECDRRRAALDAAILKHLRNADEMIVDPLARAKAAFPQVPEADFLNPGGMIRVN